jgi:hypothetical protein
MFMAARRIWVLSTEMGAAVIHAYGDRLGAEVVGVGEVRLTDDGPDADLPEPGEIDLLGLDSMNGIGHVEEVFRWARDRAARLAVPLFATAQVTTDGDVRGGTHVPHLCDVGLTVQRTAGGREIVVWKNRYGSETSIPWVLPGEETPPYYYVVTGRAGRFQLRPYPWVGSEVWDAVAQEKLPRVARPAAAAARRSGLYGGWVEPPDWEDRRRFCAARGVAYFQPGDP